MNNYGDDNEAIRKFFASRTRDRAASGMPNPIFCGREEELRKLLHAVEYLAQLESPESGLTHLIHGAQGAGKSELMLQFLSRVRDRFPYPDQNVFAVCGGPDALWDAQEFSSAFRETASPTVAGRFKDFLDKWESFGIGGILSGERKTPDRPTEIALLRKFTETMVENFDNPTVVFCVDEIQTGMPASPIQGVWKGFAPVFENAITRLKILPVYFGLGDSRSRLNNCGLTHLSQNNVIPLSTLSDDDVGWAAVKFLNSYELNGPDEEELISWRTEIIDYSSGWPRHLAHCLGAIALTHQQTGGKLNSEMFNLSMKLAHEWKSEYYQQRIDMAPFLIREEKQRQLASLFESQTHATIEEIECALKISSDGGACEAVSQAVSAGLLSYGQKGYSLAIPSMLSRLRDGRRAYSNNHDPYQGESNHGVGDQ